MKSKFLKFITQFKKYDPVLIEAIQHGYITIFESISDYSDIINSHTIPELVQYDWNNVAFGMSDGDIVNIPLSKLKIKWKGDMENVNGFDMKSYFKNVPFDSLPPIEVSFDGKNFYIEDGHHRYGYAKQLGIKSVPVKVNITANPFDTLGFYIDDIAEYKKHNTLTESNDTYELDSLDDLMNEMEVEHKSDSDKVLNELRNNLSESEFLKELITGEERYKYRKYLNQFKHDVPVESLKSQQDLNDDMINTWYEEIKYKRPVIIVNGNDIIDGHHKFAAYKKHGIGSVPIVDVNELLNYYNQSNALSESVSNSFIYPNEVVYNMVQKNHRKMEDWSDGDISERLDKYDTYKLVKLPITSINLDEWDVDEDHVDDLISGEYDGKGKQVSLDKYDPIVLTHDLSIIDGTHRANALDKLGATDIYAYIGQENSNSINESAEKSQYELKRDIVSDITRLKKWLRDNEDTYFDGDKDIVQKWDDVHDKIDELKNNLSKFNKKADVEPDGLYDNYDSPSDVPADVYNWIFKHSNILTSDATDAVRWSRIINTSNDSRYRGDMTIYRAVESNSHDEIRPGDWVTTDISYAKMHNDKYFNGNGHILEMNVYGIDVLKSPTGDPEESIYAPMELSIDIDIDNESSINESVDLNVDII